ncbi:UNVERIFIED_CONTAM: hypothetical protein GTU68_056484 [Idotea baltica]|nr:hypothetical protein [Idotea baltica]
MNFEDIIEDLIKRYPSLESCKTSIHNAGEALIECYQNEGKLLVCGNGGSASDSDHIVGELMKSFSKKQRGLPAISLSAHGALISAISNDIGGDFVFAQQVLGYGRKTDVLLAISTSGNSNNVLDACITAKAIDMKVVGLLGETGGKIKSLCDVAICVPAINTAVIQEYHLPVYHALSIMVEETIF